MDLQEQFDVLVRDQNVGSGSIESYLMPNLSPVTELINRAIERISKAVTSTGQAIAILKSIEEACC
jgi:hypothetical protein